MLAAIQPEALLRAELSLLTRQYKPAEHITAMVACAFWCFLASVVRLLFVGRPSHVSRFVVAVIVDSVKGVKRRWSWSNMLIECGERVQPFIAHANSTRSVAMVAVIARAMTSSLRFRPSVVLRGSPQSMRVVEVADIRQNGCLSAATTLVVAASNATRLCSKLLSAVAQENEVANTGLHSMGEPKTLETINSLSGIIDARFCVHAGIVAQSKCPATTVD